MPTGPQGHVENLVDYVSTSNTITHESGGEKMYPWMKNLNWRKTGLKLGDRGYGSG